MYLLHGTTIASLAILLSCSAQAALNFQISGVQTQIAGSTTDVPDSGTAANFNSNTAVNDFAVFNIQAYNGVDSPANYANLKVTYLADNGNVGSNVMIARTTNSQNLTDQGTLSVLINTSNSSGGTVTLQFDWFTYGSFTDGKENEGASLLTEKINYTSFDIDYNQLVSVEKSQIESYTFDDPTLLTANNRGDSISFEDNNARSTYNNPQSAVSFTTLNSLASHTITMGKQDAAGNALFMFEFRDPGTVAPFKNPETNPVPEPSTYGLLLGLVAITFSIVRRRN